MITIEPNYKKTSLIVILIGGVIFLGLFWEEVEIN